MVRGGVIVRSCPPPPKIWRLCGAVVSFALGVPTLKKTNLLIFKALFPALYLLAYWPLSKLKKPWKGALVPKLSTILVT